MLHAQGLVKKYSTLTVVDGVSLSVSAGEVVSIVGPSGAGKSTLLHLLAALDKPDAGRVTLAGTDVFSLAGRAQARFRNKHIGLVFQAHHLLPEFSAAENVAMPLWIGGVGRKEGLHTAETMLRTVGLGARIHHKPSQLSGGEGQRVAIARALVARPSILLADEPTGNLDTANATAVHELFLQLRGELGQTVVLVTHNEALAARTDRVVEMRDGRIVSQAVSVEEER